VGGGGGDVDVEADVAVDGVPNPNALETLENILESAGFGSLVVVVVVVASVAGC